MRQMRTHQTKIRASWGWVAQKVAGVNQGVVTNLRLPGVNPAYIQQIRSAPLRRPEHRVLACWAAVVRWPFIWLRVWTEVIESLWSCVLTWSFEAEDSEHGEVADIFSIANFEGYSCRCLVVVLEVVAEVLKFSQWSILALVNKITVSHTPLDKVETPVPVISLKSPQISLLCVLKNTWIPCVYLCVDPVITS